jgi:hypothetical protein
MGGNLLLKEVEVSLGPAIATFAVFFLSFDCTFHVKQNGRAKVFGDNVLLQFQCKNMLQISPESLFELHGQLCISTRTSPIHFTAKRFRSDECRWCEEESKNETWDSFPLAKHSLIQSKSRAVFQLNYVLGAGG